LHSHGVIGWGVIVPKNPSTGHEPQEPEWAKVSLIRKYQRKYDLKILARIIDKAYLVIILWLCKGITIPEQVHQLA
jgi:hypothetical protein